MEGTAGDREGRSSRGDHTHVDDHVDGVSGAKS